MALDIGTREFIVGLGGTTPARPRAGADRPSALNQGLAQPKRLPGDPVPSE
jgi:hypothetical protein